MAYREPKLQIFQDFEAALAGGAQPLFACCVGPNYGLHRFDVEDEQALMGAYVETELSQTFLWPDKVAGGVVDTDTADIYLQETAVRYYEQLSDVGLTEDAGNKITSNGFGETIYATNAAADRDLEFGSRDVQVGDIARLVYVDPVSTETVEFLTQVAGLEPDIEAGILPSSAALATPNGSTQEGVTPGDLPDGFALGGSGYDVTAYDGLADGYPIDSYTIRVSAVGNGTGSGGTLDGTTLQITSAGGDAITEVLGGSASWETSEYIVKLGQRGATVGLVEGASALAINDTWVVVVSQNFTEVTDIPVAGSYTGERNTQYILTVLSGGTVPNDTLSISYVSNNGADAAGSITVAAAGSFPIGSFGVEVAFADTEQFNTGATYSLDVQGQTEGAVQTLVLRDSVPLTDDGSDVTTIAIDLSLHVIDTFAIKSADLVLTVDDITVRGGIQVSTEDLLGTSNTVPVIGGTLYADYREMLTDNCNQIVSVESITDVEAVLGPVADGNPLAKAVSYALTNSNGNAVYYIPTCGADKAAFVDALDVSTQNDALYSMVPVTSDEEIKQLFSTHVIERSSEINNQWRITWLANSASDIIGVYEELSPGVNILSTVEEFSVNQYRKVVSEGALYITTGVEPGDKFRINYSTDADTGVVSYDEYIVDRVVSETTLILLGGLPAPISVAMKSEVWRDQSRTEYADSLAEEPAAYDHRRVYMVYADNPVDANGNSLELFYVAAALAGQRSGSAPHAPLSQVTLLGVDLDPVQGWSRTNLNTIASGGNWIIDKDYDGRVFTRHQISSVTNPDAFTLREQTKTTNLDDISRFFYENTKDLFGSGNISPAMISLIDQRIDSLISQISNRPYPDKIGPQMLDAEVLELQQDPVLRDTIRVVIDPDMPDPLNVLQIRFTVS